MTTLFTPLTAGELHLPNRIVMAPLTRSRAGRAHIPNELMAEYYAQRASAGLMMTEATMTAADGCAFTAEGGIFDDACAKGWRRVTDAVHSRGGRILLQLFHPGRAAHSALNNGVQPISSSDRPIRNGKIRTPQGTKEYEVPRRLKREELPGIVEMFCAGAQRAKAAGFDGVQIHGAHGYLIDQFLRDGVNDRTDDYGGFLPNRARLLLEATDAAISVFGAGRVGVRISPLVAFNDMLDSNPQELVRYVASELDRRKVAFLEIRHSDHRRPEEQAIAQVGRKNFTGALFVNGGYDLATASAALESGKVDAVVFGTLFISNPDLVERFRNGVATVLPNPSTFYTPGPVGYTDYPTAAAQRA